MDRVRFGRSLRAIRQRRGWRQQDAADAAGISRSTIGRIERGELDRTPFGDLVALVEVLEGQLGLDLRWHGADLDRLLDEGHATVVDALVRIYEDAGWEVVVEATFSEYGERGSVDVFARHLTGQVAVNEVKASVADAGGTVMGVDRKARLAPIIARKLGWECLGVSRFLVVAEGTTGRRRIATHAATFRAAFPLGGRESLAWIRAPTSRPVRGLIFLPYVHGAGAKGGSPAVRRVRRAAARSTRR
jgi:transcriptional regulator with XRE-family HTH domain